MIGNLNLYRKRPGLGLIRSKWAGMFIYLLPTRKRDTTESLLNDIQMNKLQYFKECRV